MSWYRSNFPTKLHKKIVEFVHRENAHVGETTNIPIRNIPERIDKILSKPKIIVILRNPIERAFVRYLADVRAGLEERSFEDALEIPKPKSEILKKMKMNEIKGVDENASLYITGSIYYYDLKRWSEFFPIDQMLFVTSEDLLNQPLETTNKALEFLGLESLKTIKKIGKNWEENAEKMNLSTREKLKDIFEPHNQELFNFIGKKFDW